jgi:hypothetical protein
MHTPHGRRARHSRSWRTAKHRAKSIPPA